MKALITAFEALAFLLWLVGAVVWDALMNRSRDLDTHPTRTVNEASEHH